MKVKPERKKNPNGRPRKYDFPSLKKKNSHFDVVDGDLKVLRSACIMYSKWHTDGKWKFKVSAMESANGKQKFIRVKRIA